MIATIPFNITKTSTLTGVINSRTIELTQEQFDEIESENGRVIPLILPYHSSDDREFLISGCTPEEWEQFIDEEG
jgi:hypothetical protein